MINLSLEKIKETCFFSKRVLTVYDKWALSFYIRYINVGAGKNKDMVPFDSFSKNLAVKKN